MSGTKNLLPLDLIRQVMGQKCQKSTKLKHKNKVFYKHFTCSVLIQHNFNSLSSNNVSVSYLMLKKGDMLAIGCNWGEGYSCDERKMPVIVSRIFYTAGGHISLYRRHRFRRVVKGLMKTNLRSDWRLALFLPAFMSLLQTKLIINSCFCLGCRNCGQNNYNDNKNTKKNPKTDVFIKL